MADSRKKSINYPVKENVNIGEVRISDEVVVIIAALAATEVYGVEAMAGNIRNEIVSRLGAGKLSKGVKLHVANGIVDVDLSLIIKEDYNIPEVCKTVQDRVKSAIETMTALKVASVNIRIAKVSLENA